MNKTENSYNLKGFIIGNGATKWEYDNAPVIPQTASGFDLIPLRIMESFKENNCSFYFEDFKPHEGTDACVDLNNKVYDLIADLNIYDLFRLNKVQKNPSRTEESRMGSAMVNG